MAESIICREKMADLKNESDSFLGSPDDPEDVEEDVENVEVDGDGCEDVLLRGDRVLVVATHHHLSIVDEIDGEDEDADATVDQVEHLDVDPQEGENGDHEAEEDENTEEDPATQGEVNLGLEGKESEGDDKKG